MTAEYEAAVEVRCAVQSLTEEVARLRAELVVVLSGIVVELQVANELARRPEDLGGQWREEVAGG